MVQTFLFRADAFYAKFLEIKKKSSILAQWQGSLSNDFKIQRHVSPVLCFFPHNEDWFPLSKEMSCLHF